MIRAALGVCALLLVTSCGGTAPAERASTPSAAESVDVDAAGAVPSAMEPGLRHRVVESGVGGEPNNRAAGPEVPRADLREFELGPGIDFVPPATDCQDILIFVRAGTVQAFGTGIAGEGAPATLYAGDAVRFGPEGDGKITNTGGDRARMIVAYARAVAPDGGVRLFRRGSSSDPCQTAAAPADPRVQPSRMASARTTEPLVIAGGKMRVRILLDESGAGARHGGLAVLEGDPDVTVPEHRHEDSAEVLFIEDGEGQMRIGDRQVRIRPGSVVYVPPQVLHDFRGAGTRPLRAIQVYAPSGPEQRFRALAREATGSGGR